MLSHDLLRARMRAWRAWHWSCRAVGAVWIALIVVFGCKSGIGDGSNAAHAVRSGTALAVAQGWAWIESQGSLEETQRYARGIGSLLTETVLPLIDGAALGEVTRAVADNALTLLGERVPPKMRPFILVGIDLVLARVELPASPSDRLPPAVRVLVSAFLHGVSDGCSAYLDGQAETPSGAPRDVGPLSWDR